MKICINCKHFFTENHPTDIYNDFVEYYCKNSIKNDVDIVTGFNYSKYNTCKNERETNCIDGKNYEEKLSFWDKIKNWSKK